MTEKEYDCPLDRECPSCGEDCGIDETWESETKACGECGARIVAQGDGHVMRFVIDGDDPGECDEIGFEGDEPEPDESPLSLPALDDGTVAF